jgi:hypothetical protein
MCAVDAAAFFNDNQLNQLNTGNWQVLPDGKSFNSIPNKRQIPYGATNPSSFRTSGVGADQLHR